MEIIHFFDINGEHRENVDIDVKKLSLNIDSPIKILKEYTKRNNFNSSQKDSEDKLVIDYKFQGKFGEKVKDINCNIIYNFSVSHQTTLNSLGYVVFLNLENNSIFDLLEKLIDYIKDNCSLNVKTYMIGIFSKEIKKDRTEEEMKQFFNAEDFDFEYYQMYIGNDNRIMEKYKGAANIDEIMNQILVNIFNNEKRENIQSQTGPGDRSKCSIY